MICEICQVFCQKIEGYGDRCPYCDWEECICDGEFNEDCEYCNKLGMEGNE